MKTVHLSLPATSKDLEQLVIGTAVYLTGRIFTARESVYKRAVEDGYGLPAPPMDLGTANFHCSPAAAPVVGGGYSVSAVTATASFRFAKWLDKWLELSQCNIIIGKAGMTGKVYREIFVPRKAIYLTTVGYGTGALLARGIKKVAAVHWLQELGIAQAIWVFDVQSFGPLLVEGDLSGSSLFESENAKIAEGIAKAYAGTVPATLRRFGETNDRTDELI